MRFTVRGLDRLSKRIENVRIKRIVDERIQAITKELKDIIRSVAPVDGGKFRRSIKHRFSDDGSTGSVYSDHFIGRFLEYGTGIHYNPPPPGTYASGPRLNPGWSRPMQAHSLASRGYGAFQYGEQHFDPGLTERQVAGILEQEIGDSTGGLE